MAVESCGLRLDYVGSEGAGESVDVGEGEQVWLFAHCDDIEFRRRWCSFVAGGVSLSIDKLFI